MKDLKLKVGYRVTAEGEVAALIEVVSQGEYKNIHIFPLREEEEELAGIDDPRSSLFELRIRGSYSFYCLAAEVGEVTLHIAEAYKAYCSLRAPETERISISPSGIITFAEEVKE